MKIMVTLNNFPLEFLIWVKVFVLPFRCNNPFNVTDVLIYDDIKLDI